MLVSLLLLPSAASAPLDLYQIDTLQKPITVAIKNSHVDDALKALSKETGATLEVVSSLNDLKVTIFCKQEPAARILNRVADVLGCEWAIDGATLRLRMDADKRNQLNAYSEAENRLLRDKVERSLQLLPRLARTNPSAQQRTDTTLTDAERARLEALSRNAAAVTLGRALGSLTSSQWAAFWRGEARTFADMVQAAPNQPAQPNEASRVVFRFDPVLMSFQSVPPVDVVGAATLAPYPTPPKELATMPFAREAMEWPQKSSLPTDDERLRRTVEPPSPPSGGYYVPLPTMADRLESFHRATGIAVVADGFRVVTRHPRQVMSAAQWIGTVPGFVKFSDGVLGVRHPAFWRLRRLDIPEPLLRSVEKQALTEPLSLQEYVAFAARLSRDQMAPLMLKDALSLGFDPAPLTAMLPALALCGQLSPAQRTAAMSGLAAEAMQPAQKFALQQTMLWGVLMGLGKGSSYLHRASNGDLSELGVVMSEESYESDRKNKAGKSLVGARKFRVLVGKRNEPIVFVAEAKGPPPPDED